MGSSWWGTSVRGLPKSVSGDLNYSKEVNRRREVVNEYYMLTLEWSWCYYVGLAI
jgi:hypothetical protein